MIGQRELTQRRFHQLRELRRGEHHLAIHVLAVRIALEQM